MAMWKVPRNLCARRTVAIVACGPSATLTCPSPDDFVIALGRSAELLERVDLLFAAGPHKWFAYPYLLAYQGLRVALRRSGPRRTAPDVVKRLESAGVKQLWHEAGYGLSRDPTRVRGNNGVAQTLNIAALGGARRVELHGADFRLGPDGETHWHDPHPYTQTLDFPAQMKILATMAGPLASLRVEVRNLTPGSALGLWS